MDNQLNDLDARMIEEQMDKPKIDLSHGTFNHDDIYHDDKFKRMLKDGLSGVVRDRHEREAVINTFFANRKNGLNKSEMKDALRGLRDNGTISELTEMRVRREFGLL